MKSVTKDKPETTTSAKPKMPPPGDVLARIIHGPGRPVHRPVNWIDRLRAAMHLSDEVPHDRVIGEAVARLESLPR